MTYIQSEVATDLDFLMDGIEGISSSDAVGALSQQEAGMNATILPTQAVVTKTNDRCMPKAVSTTFFPGSVVSRELGSLNIDLVIISRDGVYFYVQASLLLSVSSNNFNHFLPVTRPSSSINYEYDVLYVLDHSTILNIVLHCALNMSFRHYTPTSEELVLSIFALQTYGFSLQHHVGRDSPLFDVLMSHAMVSPLEVFELAASYELEELAVATSGHLLSLPLSMLTDECVSRIGALYLKRLLLLHMSRTETFKYLLLQPPELHTPTPICSIVQQGSMMRAWDLAGARLTAKAAADVDATIMLEEVRSSQSQITCELCKIALMDRLKLLVDQWNTVKRTI